MFGNFRVKMKYHRAYEKLILPTQLQRTGPLIGKYNKANKRRTAWVVKAAMCLSLVLVCMALFIHFANGYTPNIIDSDKTSHSADLVGNVSKPQLFELSALAFTSPKSSNGSTVSSREGTDNSVVLKYNTAITLPSGRIFSKNQPMYGKVNGKQLYEYNLPDIVFHFTGESIKKINARSESGILFDLGTDPSKDILGGIIKENVTLSPSNYIKWILNMKYTAKIIASPNFTDFESIPTDTLHFILTYASGETQEVVVTIAIDDSGEISCTLK